MIKEFSEYISQPIEYEIGDYVKIERDFFNFSYSGSTHCMIIDKDHSIIPYLCSLAAGSNFWTNKIERKLTKKEIEQYNLEYYSKKYNI